MKKVTFMGFFKQIKYEIIAWLFNSIDILGTGRHPRKLSSLELMGLLYVRRE